MEDFGTRFEIEFSFLFLGAGIRLYICLNCGVFCWWMYLTLDGSFLVLFVCLGGVRSSYISWVLFASKLVWFGLVIV